jgi:deazaflavin-dependent oxidoreductase (nitroreductase family)
MSRPDRFRWYWRFANRWEGLQARFLGFTFTTAVIMRRPALLLETTGRRTGKRRRAVLAYWEDGGDFYIGGGAAGMTKVDWVANLRAEPTAVVWVKRERFEVTAEELKGEDYERARSYSFGRWPRVAKYEVISNRATPFFRLGVRV